jgi:hypothetical protein
LNQQHKREEPCNVSKGEVFVVPGFMGSRLRKVKGFGAVKDIWVNKTELVVNGPDNLDLAYPGPAPGPLANGPLTDFGMVDTGLYEPLMKAIANAGYTPNFFSYDWRLSIRTSGQLFANVLVNSFKTKDIWVIAHSMGGLVARWAYPLWLQSSNAARWKRSIYLGVPHGGTYSAISGLCGWSPDLSLTGYIAVGVGLLVRRVQNLTGSRQSLQERYNQVLASWPAMYEMLPAQSGPFSGLDPQLSQENDARNYAPYNSHVTDARLNNALTFRTELANLLTDPRPSEVSVYASGTETPSMLDDPSKFGEVGGYKFTAHGDGVVTVERAILPGLNGIELSSSHQQIPANARFLSFVKQLLDDGLPSPIVAPNPLPEVPQPQAPPAPGAGELGPWKGELIRVGPPLSFIDPGPGPTPVNSSLPVRGDP